VHPGRGRDRGIENRIIENRLSGQKGRSRPGWSQPTSHPGSQRFLIPQIIPFQLNPAGLLQFPENLLHHLGLELRALDRRGAHPIVAGCTGQRFPLPVFRPSMFSTLAIMSSLYRARRFTGQGELLPRHSPPQPLVHQQGMVRAGLEGCVKLFLIQCTTMLRTGLEPAHPFGH